MGKILYGNMYSEIKSGSTCNTLVTEYILRGKRRGGAEIDTEVSPFLREKLRNKLPSLANRRRRLRCHAETEATATAADAESTPTSPTTTGISKSTSGRDEDTATDAAPAARSTTGAGSSKRSGRTRRRTRSHENNNNGASVVDRGAGLVERRKQVMTSASLTTLSLRDMERREDGAASDGGGGDALDR